MPGHPNHLLTDPWISTVDAQGQASQLTLPDVLAHLGSGREVEFPALQGHQRQAWLAFLVQLCALALYRFGGDLEQDADAWRTALLDLGGTPDAWQLVTDDLSRPAFFQPPIPEGHLDKFKRHSRSPSLLDVRIAAKNHDVKADLFGSDVATEHWAFALITLQTMEGFLGRGNYGIARMNGGFSSRPETALITGPGWSRRLRRDVPMLLNHRADCRLDFDYADDGLALLWTIPWQGTPGELLTLQALDPFYLEVCRRVRLWHDGDAVLAGVAPSDAARIHAKEQAGIVGDPWIPVRKENAALTVSENGFHYRLVHELLFGDDFTRPAALCLQPGERGQLWASFRVMVRGQGKTGGYHERRVLMPAKTARRIGRSDGRRAIGGLSKLRIDQTAEARQKVLKPALLKLVQERVSAPAGDNLNWKDDRAAPWLEAFERQVDAVFFPQLFDDFADLEAAPDDSDAIHRRWKERLLGLLRHQFEQASQVLAPSGIHRYRALAKARSFLEGQARKILDLTTPDPPETAPTPLSPSSSNVTTPQEGTAP